MPAIRHDNPAAIHCRLIFKLSPELMEAHVGNRSRQPIIRHHAAHVQILNADHSEPCHQCRCQLMQGIRPDMGNPRMKPGNFGLRLAPVGRAFHLAGQRPGQPLEPGQIGTQRLWPDQGVTVAYGCQTGNAEIDSAHLLAFADRRLMLNLDGQADKPSVGGTRHDRRLDLAVEPQRLMHSHPAKNGQLDAPPVDFDGVPVVLVRSIVGAETVGNAFFLEPGILAFAGEELLERCTKVLDPLLRRVLGDFKHPRELLSLAVVQLPPQRCLRWTPLSRPIYGQSKLSVKASLKGYCSLRTTLLYVPHLLPCRLMDSAAPSHGRRLWVCDTPTPDGAARRCKTQSSALTLAVPPALCCTPVDTPPRT